ncbi:MAG TPA: hypothetical protein VLA61_21320 [Ideonella sp.]|uniref:hypothetical protein n=1 Tax=Ideonella sp. TaxID=1929293 RepID=UPI002BDF0840|nr:hypothetical protein [Ideonella sp.]HSI50815.1 hypothetical protein [Ideonella sp.]
MLWLNMNPIFYRPIWHWMMLGLGTLMPELGFAATGVVRGQVEFIRTHDAAQNPSWAPPMFWFTIKGVSAAGSCQRFGGGNVLFLMSDKQAFSLAVAAQMSGLELAVTFDDTHLTNGFCVASYITTGNPAPTF